MKEFQFKIEERDGQYRVMRRGLALDATVENCADHHWWKHSHYASIECKRGEWKQWFLWSQEYNNPEWNIIDCAAGSAERHPRSNAYGPGAVDCLMGHNYQPAYFDTQQEAVDTIQYYYGTRALILEGEWRQV